MPSAQRLMRLPACSSSTDKPTLTFSDSAPVDGGALSVTCTTSAPTGVALTYTYMKDTVAITGGSGLTDSTFTLPSTAIGTTDGDYTCSATASGQTFTSDPVALARKLPWPPSLSSARTSVTPTGHRQGDKQKHTDDEPLDGENEHSDGRHVDTALVLLNFIGTHVCDVTLPAVASLSPTRFPLLILSPCPVLFFPLSPLCVLFFFLRQATTNSPRE